ncbi:MAG: MarR family transcriptional regulator [Rhodobacteraceae bacterium]|nr:MAG: MarR family transcriptional regulator [Paracoccaceae bacterium]
MLIQGCSSEISPEREEATIPVSRNDQRTQETRFWLAILRVHSTIFPVLNRSLRDDAGIGLAKLDVLAQLARHPDGLSMGDLSTALKVTNGNTSGLVNRLVKDGLVDKQMSPTDRRCFTAKLTEKGADTFRAAMDSHAATLADLMQDVSRDELIGVTDALRQMSEKLRMQARSDG